MGQVLIRNLDDDVIASLKARAERKGTSLERELRDIVSDAATLSIDERVEASRKLRAGLPAHDFDIGEAIHIGRDDDIGR
jgi:antitoxin FitA